MKLPLPINLVGSTCGRPRSSYWSIEAAHSAALPEAMAISRLVRSRGLSGSSAFTMVEIALSIAIVAFGLVAIIGVLPTGLDVQRENREDTIMNQDATVLMEAIRGGPSSAGLSILTNNLEWIQGTRGSTPFAFAPPLAPPDNTPQAIVSLLSMPRQGGVNFCQARFRSFSGSLRDRDTNAASVAFGFIVTSEINPVEDYSATVAGYSNYSRFLSNNLYDVKLTMRWPVFNNTNVGKGKLTLRSVVSGSLTNAITTNNPSGFWFFQTSTFYGP